MMVTATMMMVMGHTDGSQSVSHRAHEPVIGLHGATPPHQEEGALVVCEIM